MDSLVSVTIHGTINVGQNKQNGGRQNGRKPPDHKGNRPRGIKAKRLNEIRIAPDPNFKEGNIMLTLRIII